MICTGSLTFAMIFPKASKFGDTLVTFKSKSSHGVDRITPAFQPPPANKLLKLIVMQPSSEETIISGESPFFIKVFGNASP